MKKIVFYIPVIIFSVPYGLIALDNVRYISPIVIIWLLLYLSAGIFLSKDRFWGGLLGALPAIHLIYKGTQDTGQIFNEMPIGIIVLIFYVICGSFIFYRSKKLKNQLDL